MGKSSRIFISSFTANAIESLRWVKIALLKSPTDEWKIFCVSLDKDV